MLTPEQRSEFADRGFIRLRGVFSRAEAAAMEERVWDALGRKHGVRREDPATWRIPLGAGLQSLRTHSVFEPIGGPTLFAALDDLIAGGWEEPKHWGQFLVSFPIPEGGAAGRPIWHTDFPYSLPDDRVAGALVFSFVGEVPAGCGGTLVIAGSPALVARFLRAKPHLRQVPMKAARRALVSSDPSLKALGDGALAAERAVADDPIRVVELCGEPGDVVIGHPWLLHTPAPNRGDRPRFMRVQRIRSTR